MTWKTALLLAGCVLACSSLAQPTNQADRLREFKRRAAAFNAVITVPQFEMTTNAIRFTLFRSIAVGNAALDRLGALKPREVTFDNTVRALDDIGYQISLADDRFGLIKETSTDAALREAATDALKALEEWSVGIEYREDVYKTVKAYADKKPKLQGEDARSEEHTSELQSLRHLVCR